MILYQYLVILSATFLVGCGSTVSQNLYEISSKAGTVEYSKPTGCYGPSYWYSAKIHPGVRLVVEEGHYGRGVISIALQIARDMEAWFDGPVKMIEPSTGDQFEFPPYTLQMLAGEKPTLSHSMSLFGPGKEPSSIQKDRIYDGGDSYHYNVKFRIPQPHREELLIRVPAARVGDTRTESIVIHLREIKITWRKACYDFR